MTLPATLHQPLTPGARELMAAFRFVLVSPSHAGNIGSVVRAMATMGLHDLVVVSPKQTDFANDPQARALASGARRLLAQARQEPTVEAAVADCQLVIAVSASPREFGPPPGTPAEVASQALQELRGGGVRKVALIFGTERTGLSVQEMALCQLMVSIPADPEYSSLNLSQAAQILAFSLRQQVMRAPDHAVVSDSSADIEAVAPDGASGEVLADHAAIERLHAHLEQALVSIGYLDLSEPKRLMPRLRRLFARTRLEVPEVDLLRGICKQMEKLAASAASAKVGASSAGAGESRRVPVGVAGRDV